MGLRCLIGHDYGDPETARDREERGDEVIVTVREYRECSRCGHRHIISENKEVKAGGFRQGVEGTAAGDGPPSQTTGDGGDDSAGVEPFTAGEDDGVILEDDPELNAERGYGEWPASDPNKEEEEREEAPAEWPAIDAEDEGYDAEAPEAGPAGGVEFGGSLTPQATGDTDDDSEEDDVVERASADTPPTGIRRATPGPDPSRRQRLDDPDTVYVCPECDHTVAAIESSLRPGDICPECRKGYLTERATQGRNP